MRILRQEILRGDIEVGEITAATAGNADFFTGAFGVVNEKHATASVGSAHQARSACADDECVVFHIVVHAGGVPSFVDKFKGRRLVLKEKPR